MAGPRYVGTPGGYIFVPEQTNNLLPINIDILKTFWSKRELVSICGRDSQN